MLAEERRNQIRNILSQANSPVSAGRLAAELKVSRQIIVGDIALLRASGEDISATPRGYLYEAAQPAGFIRRIACCHDAAGTEEELNIMVDNGCTVLDVIVEHPVYGEITGSLQIHNRYEVQQFLDHISASSALPLSALTEGIHLHTICCSGEDVFLRTVAELEKAGFIYKEDR